MAESNEWAAPLAGRPARGEAQSHLVVQLRARRMQTIVKLQSSRRRVGYQSHGSASLKRSQGCKMSQEIKC